MVVLFFCSPPGGFFYARSCHSFVTRAADKQLFSFLLVKQKPQVCTNKHTIYHQLQKTAAIVWDQPPFLFFRLSASNTCFIEGAKTTFALKDTRKTRIEGGIERPSALKSNHATLADISFFLGGGRVS